MAFLEKLNQINQLLDKIKILNANVSDTNGFSSLEADLIKQHLRNLYDRYSDLEKFQQLQNAVKVQHKADAHVSSTNLMDEPELEEPELSKEALFINLPPQAAVEPDQPTEIIAAQEEDTFELKDKDPEDEIEALEKEEETVETASESEQEIFDSEEPLEPDMETASIAIEEEELISEEELVFEPEETEETTDELDEDLAEIEAAVETPFTHEEEQIATNTEDDSVDEELVNENELAELESKTEVVEEAFTAEVEVVEERTVVVKESEVAADHTWVSMNKVVEAPAPTTTQKEPATLSLFEKYQQRAATQDLNLKNNPVKSIKQLISLNDKFVIIKELFGNAISKYDAMIEAIDKSDNLDSALTYMETEVWNTDELRKKEELIKRVTTILSRKFN